MRNIILLVLFTTVVFSCNSNTSDKNKFDTITIADIDSVKKVNEQDTATVIVSTSKLQDTLQELGTQVLHSLKNKDYITFSSFFHPTEGVLFSPYGYIDVPKRKKLLAKDFLESIDKNWTLTWGTFDGTGEAMKLKVIPYLDKFVYNADYLSAEKSAFDEFIGKGNSLNNLVEIYPNLHFMEYYFSGFDKKYNGMDWTSLRLVFKSYQGKYYLVAVVHDQWTS
jgi:hypothetical protein